MKASIHIQYLGHCTQIVNDSEFDIIISIKPRKPKRKIIDYRCVQKGTQVIFEEKIDLKDIYLSFLTDERTT